jgi:hypothetical protein
MVYLGLDARWATNLGLPRILREERMTKRGTFQIHRALFEHPFFAPEPFTEREAWQWLIAEAAWRHYARTIGNRKIDLRRGQLAVSIRYLAARWKWPPTKVYRFFARLKAHSMIEVSNGARFTIVTICNYSKYQRYGGTSADAMKHSEQKIETDCETLCETVCGNVSRCDDKGNDMHKKSSETISETLFETVDCKKRNKREERIIEEYIGGGGDARASARARAFDLAVEVAKIAGYPDPHNWPPGWCGAPLRVEGWLREPGWSPEIIIAACQAAMRSKRDGPPTSVAYFERAIAREVARQSAPLPTVQLHDRGNYNGRSQQSERERSKDRFRAAYAKLGEYISAADAGDLAGDDGAQIIRLLPTARRDGP